MKTFRFPLQRVLDWRTTQLEIEQARYQKCAAAVAALDHARAELEASAIQAEVQVREWRPVAGADLVALDSFQNAVRAKERSIAIRRVEAAKAAEAQMTVMLEAQRRCRLLERLKDQRLADWRIEEEKDLEAVGTEAYLARWNSEQRRSRDLYNSWDDA